MNTLPETGRKLAIFPSLTGPTKKEIKKSYKKKLNMTADQ